MDEIRVLGAYEVRTWIGLRYFDLEHVKVILGSFSALFSKLGQRSKAHRRTK